MDDHKQILDRYRLSVQSPIAIVYFSASEFRHPSEVRYLL